MQRGIERAYAAAAASITALSMLGGTGNAMAGAAAGGAIPAKPAASARYGAAPAPGTRLWVSRYNGPGNGFDFAGSVAVSRAGGAVFVTGASAGKTSGSDYATVAYRAGTGARLWASRYNGPASGEDGASSLAASPGGGVVFVTGRSTGATSGGDYATVAYRASTGARLWVSRYNGPASRDDSASSLAVGPGGGTVFVTGTSAGAGSGADYLTVAYNAATGMRLWVSRYNGPANRADSASKVAVSPGGGIVFVTGESAGKTSGPDYATVAYNAATGARLWVSRYNSPAGRSDRAASLAVGPGGRRIFVTGESAGKTSGSDYATVACNAATGARLWVKRYNGPANRDDVANSVAVSPGGGEVLVTGTSNSVGLDVFDASRRPAAARLTPTPDYATVAYRAATGARLWARRYNGPGNGLDFAYSTAVSPNGRTVFVTGFSIVRRSHADYATIAYRTASGGQLWARRYNGPANAGDAFPSLAVSPRGGRVFVTGTSTGITSGQDYATIAYRG
jgi:hypothetical protein